MSLFSAFPSPKRKILPPTLAVAVVDNHPRFFCEVVLWTICARRNTKFDLAVVFIDTAPNNLSEWLRAQGVQTVTMETLLTESPHCNKILPGRMFPGRRILVTDCDVFMLNDFDFMLHPKTAGLPENNHCNPPFSTFESILEAYGLSGPFEPGLSIFSSRYGRETLGNNVSCGVIWIPPELSDLWVAWEDCARWLLQNREIMGPYKVHVDQIAMAIALEETKVRFRHLPAQTNAILHLLPDVRSLYAIHLTSGHIPRFPEWFDANRHLMVPNNPHISGDLEKLNSAIDEAIPLLATFPETATFAENFLNPNWKRKL